MLHDIDRSVYGFRYGTSEMFAMVDDLDGKTSIVANAWSKALLGSAIE